MQRVSVLFVAAFCLMTLSAVSADAQSSLSPEARAHRQVIADKKRACRREARGQHFGVHLVKRNRFIRDCVRRP